MGSIKELEAQRDSVLEQLRAIRSLERGSISEQYLKGSARGKPVVRGPYYVVSRHEGGRTVSRRRKAHAKGTREATRGPALEAFFARTARATPSQPLSRLGVLYGRSCSISQS